MTQTSAAASPQQELRLLIATLFLTALCTLLVEIILTRVLSVVMWYHFTFAVISVSLLGIAAGAMRCHLHAPPTWANDQTAAPDLWPTIRRTLTLFSLTMLLPLVLMLFWIETPTLSTRGLILLLGYFFTCAAPFAVSGYITAFIVRSQPNRVSVLYAADLAGGSLGCLLSIPLLNMAGGIGSLLVASLAASTASLVLALKRPSRRPPTAAFASTVAIGAVLVMQSATGQLDLHTVKLSGREILRPIIAVKWNSHSRLAMLDYFTPGERSPFPFLAWGLSDRYHGWLPRQYLITIDGASETPVTELKEDIRAHEYLAWDVTSLPYHLRKGGKTLIIGAGGGRDSLTALWFGARDITAVELNRGIVDWVRGPYASFAGHLYDRPELHVVVDDGRNFVRASPAHYDVLQISMIDTFAATAAGAYVLSENNLYTAEAFDEYLAHLTDQGILSINRFFLDPPQQTLRIVTLAREALARRGIADAAAHVAVVRKGSLLGDNGLVMIKTAPFRPEEVDAIERLCAEAGYQPVALPGRELTNPFTQYLREPRPERFYEAYPFDVAPPADDRPFFFNTFKTQTAVDWLRLRGRVEPIRVYNYDATFILFVLLGFAAVSLALFIFLPLLRHRRVSEISSQPRLPPAALAYFVWVGLGFILVEIVWIQRFQLYLGHPVYSLAVILVSILAFSGLGSAWTARCPDIAIARWLTMATIAVVVLIAGYELGWRAFLAQTLGLPIAVRVALTAAVLMPLGVCLGMPYPLGLRAVAMARPHQLPWVWAVNGSASVLGSILAFALAIALGFRMVLLLGAVCYLAALVSSRLLPRTVAVGAVAPNR